MVSDTSPISNLMMIGRLHLLPDLFQHVYVPDAVWQELGKLTQFGVDTTPIRTAPWLTVKEPADQALIRLLMQDLNPGEAAAIALAIELQIPTILIDEKPGRTFAQKYSLTPTGVLGMLLRAKTAGHIPWVKPEVDRLRNEARFYVSDPLYRQMLKLAGEN